MIGKILSQLIVISLFWSVSAISANRRFCPSFVVANPYRNDFVTTKWSSGDARKVHSLFDQVLLNFDPSPLEKDWKYIDDRVGVATEVWNSFYSGTTLTRHEEELFQMIQRRRCDLSRTLMGKRDGENASVAVMNWKKADAQTQIWANTGQEITLEKIKQLNKVLGEGLDFNGGAAGEYRARSTGVGYLVRGSKVFQHFIPASDIPNAMRLFVEWLSEDGKYLHPVELAGLAYQRLVSIHPFRDGNGRTARLVADWILLKNGYPPILLTDSTMDAAIFADDLLKVNAQIGQTEKSATKGMIRMLNELCRSRDCVSTKKVTSR